MENKMKINTRIFGEIEVEEDKIYITMSQKQIDRILKKQKRRGDNVKG